MENVIATALGAFATGGVVGFLAGLLGVGGGAVLVPVFRLLFGMSAVGSTATSLFTIIPTSISGGVSHVLHKTCALKVGLALGLGGACLSPVGVWLAQHAPSWLIMVAVACIIVYTSTNMFRKALALPKAGGSGGAAVSGGAAAAPAQAVPPAFDQTGRVLAKAVLVGAAAGLASGFTGLGGGFLMVPLMASFLHMPMKLTSGTSLIAIMILALPAAVAQCLLGNVDVLVGIAVACGTVPGAFVGAKQVNRLSERTLRLAFGSFLLVGAVLLVAKEVALLV